jgi:ketosteroid isomerase-like protein
MLNRRRTIVGALLLAAYFPMQAAAETGDKTRELGDAEVASLVRQANSSWDEDFNRANSAALASHYVTSPMILPPKSAPLRDAAAIAAFFQKLFDNGVSKHSIERVSAKAAGNLIYETARWKAFASAANGGAMFEGSLLLVYEVDKSGQPKIAAQIWN